MNATVMLTSRRSVLKNTILSLAAFSGVTASVIADTLDARSPSLLNESVLSEEQFQLVAALSDHLLPETNIPGAIRAGVPDFITMMLSHIYSNRESARFVSGLIELKVFCYEKFGRSFFALNSEERNTLFDILDAQMQSDIALGKQSEGKKTFYIIFKEASLLGFVTSKIVAEKHMYYEPYPGPYRGNVPIEETGGKAKAIATVYESHPIRHSEWSQSSKTIASR